MTSKRRVVVFISGFLTPPNWISHPSSVPDDVVMINVYPSPTGSLHDRACQVFYELIGGTVDYGIEHSAYHGHSRFGTHYPVAKYPMWSKDNPIQVVGHSFGGLTAWVLQNYLATKRFPGYDTSESWISSLIAVNTPFNGVIRDHEKGLHQTMPPVVRWCSQGYLIGLIVNIFEYIDSDLIRKIINLDQAPWNLSHKYSGSLLSLIHSFLGVCIHSTTDNISYDASIGSQLAWSRTLRTFPHCSYFSVVGRKELVNIGSLLEGLYYLCGYFKSRESRAAAVASVENNCRMHPNHHTSHVIQGVNTAHWMERGEDLLLSVFTQEYPRIGHHSPPHRQFLCLDDVNKPDALSTGCWQYLHCDLTHLSVSFQDTTAWSTIWEVGRALHKQAVTKEKHLRLNPLTGLVNSHDDAGASTSSPPDCQPVSFSLSHRHTLLYSWSAASGATALAVILLLLLYTLYLLDALVLSLASFRSLRPASVAPDSYLAALFCVAVALDIEVLLLIRQFFRADVTEWIDSDVSESLFSLFRLLTVALTLSSASPSVFAVLHSGLFLLECLVLLVSSHCRADQYHRLLTQRRGIREYSLLRTKLLLGLVYGAAAAVIVPALSRPSSPSFVTYLTSFVSRSISSLPVPPPPPAALLLSLSPIFSVCVNLLLLAPKLSWFLVSRWSSGRVSFKTAYRLQMSLWLVMAGAVAAVIRETVVTLSPLTSSCSYCNSVSMVLLSVLVCVVSGGKGRDMAESFQVVMIKNKYRNKS